MGTESIGPLSGTVVYGWFVAFGVLLMATSVPLMLILLMGRVMGQVQMVVSSAASAAGMIAGRDAVGRMSGGAAGGGAGVVLSGIAGGAAGGAGAVLGRGGVGVDAAAMVEEAAACPTSRSYWAARAKAATAPLSNLPAPHHQTTKTSCLKKQLSLMLTYHTSFLTPNALLFNTA